MKPGYVPTMPTMASGRPMDVTTANAAGHPNARQQNAHATRRRRRLRRNAATDSALAAASG